MAPTYRKLSMGVMQLALESLLIKVASLGTDFLQGNVEDTLN